jgi:hypothetical protein
VPGGGPLLNIQWWLVGMLLGPMARRRMLGVPGGDCCPASGYCCKAASARAGATTASGVLTSSPFRTISSCCVPQILESPYPFESDADSENDDDDRDADDDDDDLSYGAIYMTPPRPATSSSILRVAGQGRKRSTPSPTSTELSSSHSPSRPSRSARHHPRRSGHRQHAACCHRHCTHLESADSQNPPTSLAARHSPWLWLKFSITLAVAVGAAFRYGPGRLLPGTPANAAAPCCCPQHRSRNGRCRAAAGRRCVSTSQIGATSQERATEAMTWWRVKRDVFGRD